MDEQCEQCIEYEKQIDRLDEENTKLKDGLVAIRKAMDEHVKTHDALDAEINL